jgi:hypothetical protein
MDWGSEACEKLLASEHIDALFDQSREQKFDVLITEFFNTDCVLGLAYKLNISTYIGMVRIITFDFIFYTFNFHFHFSRYFDH